MKSKCYFYLKNDFGKSEIKRLLFLNKKNCVKYWQYYSNPQIKYILSFKLGLNVFCSFWKTKKYLFKIFTSGFQK